MKEIYFIRHGQTKYNKLRIVQGSGVDSDLNEKGRNQAQAFFDKYSDIDFDVVLTSKLKRTHQTAKGFIDKGIPWEQFEDINEICWGVHEGKGGDIGMKYAYEKMVREWGIGNLDYRLEEAESANELAERVQRFINQLKTRKENRILVCSHGRTMRCMICLLKGEHLREMEKYMHKNTGLYKVHLVNDKFEVIIENDVSHLK